MKIAICVNGRPHEGGVTSFINSVSDGLRELGHHVDIITIFGISKYRNVKKNFVASTDKVLKNSEFKTFVLYIISKVVLLINFAFAYKKNKYDILFAVDMSVINATKCFTKTKNISVFLNTQSSISNDLINQGKIKKNSFVERYIISEESRAYENAKGIIANSKYTANYIKKINPKHACLTIIRNVVDHKKFSKDIKKIKIEKIKYNISNDSWVVLFVGRIVNRKGVRYLARAFRDFIKTDTNATLVLVGEGEEGDNELQVVNQIVKEFDLGPNVIFLGSIPNKEVGELYNIADTLVVPSITYKGLEEPLGITALEGMASSVPIVASKIGGLKEIIKEKHNGLLVPERNSEAIAEALKKLKEDSFLRKKLIANGLKYIEEACTPVKVAEKIISFFKSSCPKDLRTR